MKLLKEKNMKGICQFILTNKKKILLVEDSGNVIQDSNDSCNIIQDSEVNSEPVNKDLENSNRFRCTRTERRPRAEGVEAHSAERQRL